jgi:hypothetical protein
MYSSDEWWSWILDKDSRSLAATSLENIFLARERVPLMRKKVYCPTWSATRRNKTVDRVYLGHRHRLGCSDWGSGAHCNSRAVRNVTSRWWGIPVLPQGNSCTVAMPSLTPVKVIYSVRTKPPPDDSTSTADSIITDPGHHCLLHLHQTRETMPTLPPHNNTPPPFTETNICARSKFSETIRQR